MENFDLWPQPAALGQVIAIDLVLSPILLRWRNRRKGAVGNEAV